MAYSAPSTISTGDLITAAIWNQDVVANPIAIYAGAMSVTSQAVGDILYASSTTQLGRIAAVATGQVLTSAGTGTVPAWSSNLDLGGTLDVTGATTLDGTLGVGGASTGARLEVEDGGISHPGPLLIVRQDTDDVWNTVLCNDAYSTTALYGCRMTVGTNGDFYIYAPDKTSDPGGIKLFTDETQRLEVTSDGRGLSQFTAKAWVRFDQVADSVLDSHNVSSVDDDATGEFTVNFTNNMANINYAGIGMSEDDRFMTSHQSTRPAVGAMKFQCTHYNGNRYDEDNNACLFFGD
jgi:hypothetical protein